MGGDVFGEWNLQGIEFTLLTRDKLGKYQFKGKWAEVLRYVKEGNCRCGADAGDDSMVTTLGTFQLSIVGKDEEIEENAPALSSFRENLKHYTSTAPLDRLFYDFKIQSRDGIVLPAHKLILASQTRYFEGLFRQENTDQVSLDFDSKVIKKCLDYLYTGHLNIEGGDVQDLLMFANYVVIQEIVTKCELFIARNLDTSNCLDVLKFGHQMANKSLITVAQDMTCRNLQKVLSNQMDLANLPLPFYREIISSDSVLIYSQFGTLLTGHEREKALGEHIKSYISAGGMTEEEEKDLLSLLRMEDEAPAREGGLALTYMVSNTGVLGRPGDSPRTIREFRAEGEGKKWIRGVRIKTVTWDGREVVGGMALAWSDNTQDCFGMSEEEAINIPLSEVDEGHHVSFVFGRSGWYVDALAFVTSSGKILGSKGVVGGDGGGFRHTLGLLNTKYNTANIYLDGVKGKEVKSQSINLLSNLLFIYRIAADHGTDAEKLEVPGSGSIRNFYSSEDSEDDDEPDDYFPSDQSEPSGSDEEDDYANVIPGVNPWGNDEPEVME